MTNTIARLEAAGRTLLSMPGRPTLPRPVTGALALLHATRRPYVPAPSGADVEAMHEAFRLIAHIPLERLILRTVVACRSLVCPMYGNHLHTWQHLASHFGTDVPTVNRWHTLAVNIIDSERLNSYHSV